MNLRQLPATEKAVVRFVEDLWLPYHRELERTIDRHSLADQEEVITAEIEHRLEQLQTDNHQIWIIHDAPQDPETDFDLYLSNCEAVLIGFISTHVEESPVVFPSPKQLVISDIYVIPSYRGSGLSRQLIDRAVTRAKAEECGELALDVDLQNERALAFYDKMGFEPYRCRMALHVDGR